jgi:hypothetical protein
MDLATAVKTTLDELPSEAPSLARGEGPSRGVMEAMLRHLTTTRWPAESRALHQQWSKPEGQEAIVSALTEAAAKRHPSRGE